MFFEADPKLPSLVPYFRKLLQEQRQRAIEAGEIAEYVKVPDSGPMRYPGSWPYSWGKPPQIGARRARRGPKRRP